METRPNNISKSVLKSCILKNALSSGWVTVDDLSFKHTTAVATKDYPSAVGVKTAIMYLNRYEDNGFKVTAHYQSEGQNILETTWLVLANQLTFETIKTVVEGYLRTVDKIISKSYAVRLLNDKLAR